MSRFFCLSRLFLMSLCPGGCCFVGAQNLDGTETHPLLEIRSVNADGHSIPLRLKNRLRLSALPGKVTFGFGSVTNSDRTPPRIRYKLDGYDESWREIAGEMRLALRFIDDQGDHISETRFRAIGQTPGWTGRPEGAVFVHRAETIRVPPRATGFWVVMSSAGPPAAVGVYWITNLSVVRSSDSPPEVLIEWPFAGDRALVAPERIPAGWQRDGLRPTMAKIAKVGIHRNIPALEIVDDDVIGHAEWHTVKELAPAVSPGELLNLEWDEAYSIGLAESAEVLYPELPAGYFRFRVSELSILGIPGEAEDSLAVEVPLSFWKTPWFWIAVSTAGLAGLAGSGRYLGWRRMRRQLRRLEQQRAVDRERLRIAQDIHDDLGARVTQISLLSAVAQRKTSLPDEARADFGTVSRMTRDLVSALYETVWAVNPENDNLDALANYLCQVGNQLCSHAQLRCRLEVMDLPPSIPLDSQVRHNLIMSVKEAVHNVIKHARASEVRIAITLNASRLSISIQDDGCGFDPSICLPGNGLVNLKRRLGDIGGMLAIESQTGRGTRIGLHWPVPQPL